MLVKKLFNLGFSIDEIIFLTKISLGTLSKYITTEQIMERTEVKSLDKRHPYIELFRK